jgi:hypothetical protein
MNRTFTRLIGGAAVTAAISLAAGGLGAGIAAAGGPSNPCGPSPCPQPPPPGLFWPYSSVPASGGPRPQSIVPSGGLAGIPRPLPGAHPSK